jgi:glycosyltransferase involved in cell wall biosynthesis
MNLVCNELANRGFQVNLIPINYSPPDLVELLCETYPIKREWQAGILGTLKALWRFNLIVQKWNPDIVVLNCDLPEMFGLLLFRKQNLIAIEHVSSPWITRPILGRIVRKLLDLRGCVWVAVSSHLRIWPEKFYPKTVILNPIVPNSNVKGLPSNSSTCNKIERIVFIGRLAPQKRPNWILEICSGNSLPAIVIGDGSMRQSLELQSRARNLLIDFPGAVRDPWSMILPGDLVVVPSEYEGDGLVVVESLSAGVAFLLADISDFRRFELPERNYCKSVDDFLERIATYSEDLTQLVVPHVFSKDLLASRSILRVGNDWVEFLNSEFE